LLVPAITQKQRYTFLIFVSGQSSLKLLPVDAKQCYNFIDRKYEHIDQTLHDF